MTGRSEKKFCLKSLCRQPTFLATAVEDEIRHAPSGGQTGATDTAEPHLAKIARFGEIKLLKNTLKYQNLTF